MAQQEITITCSDCYLSELPLYSYYCCGLVQTDMKIMNTLLILVLTNVLSCIVYINSFKVYCIIYSCTFFSGHGFHKFCCPLRECILCMDFN